VGETPGFLLTGAGKGKGEEGVKGILPLKVDGGKDRRGGEGGESRGGKGPVTGGSCSNVLRGDRRP